MPNDFIENFNSLMKMSGCDRTYIKVDTHSDIVLYVGKIVGDTLKVPNGVTKIRSHFEIEFSGDTVYNEINGRKVATVFAGNNIEDTELETIVIPDSVVNICDCAMIGQANLAEIIGGNNVKSVGKRAFKGLQTLQRVEFLNATHIGDEAFMNCWRVTSAKLPAVEHIGSSAFSACTMLSKFEGAPITVKKSAFYGVGAVKQIDLTRVKNIETDAFQWNYIEEIKFDKLDILREDCFRKCEARIRFNSIGKIYGELHSDDIILIPNNDCVVELDIPESTCYEAVELKAGREYSLIGIWRTVRP